MKQLFTDLEAGVHVGLTICAGSFDIQDFWSLIYEKRYTLTISRSHFSHKVNMQISPMMSVSQFTAPFGLEQPSALITKIRFNSNTTADAFEAALHWLALAACVCLSKQQLFKTLNRRRVRMQCRFLPPEGASCQNFWKLKRICRACVGCWLRALHTTSSPHARLVPTVHHQEEKKSFLVRIFKNSSGFVAHVSAVDCVHFTQPPLHTHV